MTNSTTTTTKFVSAYVLYKQVTYLIADVRGTKLLLIDKSGTKLQVLKTSVRVYPNWRVCSIEMKGVTYWVTRNGNILSTSTFKWIWKVKSPMRDAILQVSQPAWEAKKLKESAQ